MFKPAENKLTPISALGAVSPQSIAVNNYTICEVTDRAMASVAALKTHEKAAAKTIARLIGADAPSVARWSGGTELTAFWTGAGQWMVDAPMSSHEDITAILAPDFAGIAVMTEQSFGWCRFEISGIDANGVDRLCGLLCALDMRETTADSSGGGAAARTSIEHIGCFVMRLTATKIHIIAPRSSAESLYHAIKTAMVSADH